MYNFKYYRLVPKYLPSYLSSFNYKLHFEFLPLKCMFKEWQLDNDSCCMFCEVCYETTFHLFGVCEKLKGLWTILLRETHVLLTGEDFNYEYQRNNLKLDLVSVQCNGRFEKTLVYLNTITNYSIWRHRNDIRYKFVNFDLKTITKKMMRSIGARRGVEPNMSDSYKIPHIDKLFEALRSAVNHYPFDNG